MGLGVPKDLAIVAHGNFPLLEPEPLDITRVGFSTQTILETCMDLIMRQRAGGEVPAITEVMAAMRK